MSAGWTRTWSICAALMAALSCMGALAGAARAHYSILVREVRASAASPDSAFIELQAYEPRQGRIASNVVESYSSNGLIKHTFTLTSNLGNDQSQRTLLIGDTGVAGRDLTDAALSGAIAPAGGAVCFPQALPPDCVAWGTFSGGGSLPLPGAGPPAPAIAEGQSLTRTIARGCATALDVGDDTNSSAADFALIAPSPRPNAASPSEVECVPCTKVDATLVGTEDRDLLVGTPGDDVIAGRSGKDTLRGMGGDDVLCGGIGKDRLIGGSGRDRLIGGFGRDRCKGGGGRDRAAKSCEVRKAI